MYRGFLQLADKQHKGNTSMLYPYLYVVFVVICGYKQHTAKQYFT